VKIISTESHPHILEAIHLVQDDTEAHPLAIPVQEVPDRWSPHLTEIDEVLGKLSRTVRAAEEEPLPPHVKPSELLDSELYSFCNGDGLVQERIANRDMSLLKAHVFLADYFEGWTYTTLEGGDTPENRIRQKRIEWLDMVERESTIGLTQEQRAEREQLNLSLT
jgi:hypothetical protein